MEKKLLENGFEKINNDQIWQKEINGKHVFCFPNPKDESVWVCGVYPETIIQKEDIMSYDDLTRFLDVVCSKNTVEVGFSNDKVPISIKEAVIDDSFENLL